MKVNDSTFFFFQLYDSTTPIDLNEYYQRYPGIFKTYFNGYCKKTDAKMQSAIKQFSDDYSKLKNTYRLLPAVLEKIDREAKVYFGFSLNVPIHLFIGLYASNAFVDHRAEIYLSIEMLPNDPRLLEVLVAHEIIHSYHYHLLDDAGIDWITVDWKDVRNSLYLEGVATYLSQKLVPGLPKSVYFAYDDDGEDWYSFCRSNHREIAEAFRNDLKDSTKNKEREWLKLSGGKRFGYSRLGYFLGTEFVVDLMKKMSESEVLELLAKGKVSVEFDKWINQ